MLLCVCLHRSWNWVCTGCMDAIPRLLGAQVWRHWLGHQIFADVQGGHLERQERGGEIVCLGVSYVSRGHWLYLETDSVASTGRGCIWWAGVRELLYILQCKGDPGMSQSLGPRDQVLLCGAHAASPCRTSESSRQSGDRNYFLTGSR